MPKGKKTVAPKATKKSQTRDEAPEGVTIPGNLALQTAAFGQQVTEEGQAATTSLFGPEEEEDKKGKKKKEEPLPDKETRMSALIETINAQFKGRAVLRQGSEITNVFILRRPTGITTLDLSIGGGLPAGGLTQIIGRFSAGKSYLANKIMAMAQYHYGNDFAASVNMTEMRYDKFFAKQNCGLRVAYSEKEIAVLRHIQVSRGLPDLSPEYITWLRDQVGYFVEGTASSAEGILEIAVQQVESNEFQVVLIDSFGALLTKAEAEAEEGLEQKYRGGAAMVVTAFMHRLHAALNLPDKRGRPNTTTVIGINQYRDNVGAGVYGNPMKVAGGHALAHGKLLDIHVEQGAKIRVKTSATENVIVGKEINWEIMKGKAGCHDGPKGTYKLYLGEAGFPFGVDLYSDLISAGLQTGVLQRSGAWFSYRGEYIGQGAEATAQYLYTNQAMLSQIRDDIFKTSGLNFIVRE